MSLREICRWLLIGVLVFVLAACGGKDEEEAGGGVTGGGGNPAAEAAPAGNSTIAGSVKFTGAAPEPEIIDMGAEPTCAGQYAEGPFAQTVVVNDNGTLSYVFVYVKSGLEGKTFATPNNKALLDQKGCRYAPHVLGTQTGQTIVIRNSDEILHNIHPQPKNSRPFNIGQPKQGMETEKSFSAPEVMIQVGCDVHGWMSAYIGVVDHPYFAVTGEDGSFSLPNLPAGDYVLEAWHEKYGAQEMKVTVGEGETANIEFTFKGG
jgi:hypothetical protein